MSLYLHLYLLIGIVFYCDPKVKKDDDNFFVQLVGLILISLVWPLRLIMLIIEPRR